MNHHHKSNHGKKKPSPHRTSRPHMKPLKQEYEFVELDHHEPLMSSSTYYAWSKWQSSPHPDTLPNPPEHWFFDGECLTPNPSPPPGR